MKAPETDTGTIVKIEADISWLTIRVDNDAGWTGLSTELCEPGYTPKAKDRVIIEYHPTGRPIIKKAT